MDEDEDLLFIPNVVLSELRVRRIPILSARMECKAQNITHKESVWQNSC